MSYNGAVLSSIKSPVEYPLHMIITDNTLFMVDERYPRSVIKAMTLTGELLNIYHVFEVNASTQGTLSLMEGDLWYITAGRGLAYRLQF